MQECSAATVGRRCQGSVHIARLQPCGPLQLQALSRGRRLPAWQRAGRPVSARWQRASGCQVWVDVARGWVLPCRASLMDSVQWATVQLRSGFFVAARFASRTFQRSCPRSGWPEPPASGTAPTVSAQVCSPESVPESAATRTLGRSVSREAPRQKHASRLIMARATRGQDDVGRGKAPR